MMKDPVRWGKAPRLTKSLREGKPGIPAIPLYRPFAGWVARGWRREKYLFMHPAAGRPTTYYLYATAGKAPEEYFIQDDEDLFEDLFDGSLEREDELDAEVSRRRSDPASQVKSAVVGLGVLDYIEEEGKLSDEHRVWIFAGGALLPEPIPLSRLVNRPYGGVFYPFGR